MDGVRLHEVRAGEMRFERLRRGGSVTLHNQSDRPCPVRMRLLGHPTIRKQPVLAPGETWKVTARDRDQ